MTIVREAITNDDGQVVDIYIEVDDKSVSPGGGRDTRGGLDQIGHAQAAFTKAMDLIHTCAEHVAETVGKIKEEARPHGFEIQLSIKIDAEVGAIIAKSRSEAQIQVTLRWEK